MNKISDIVYIVKAEYEGSKDFQDVFLPILYKQIKENMEKDKGSEICTFANRIETS